MNTNSDEQKPESDVIESIQKEDNVLMKARKIDSAIKNNNLSVVKIANEIKVSSAYISRYQRLLKLPEAIQDGYMAGLVSPSHLFVISRLKTEEDMMSVYEEVLTKSLAVHQIEDIIRKKLFNVEGEGKRVDNYTLELIQDAASGVDKKLFVKVVQTRIGVKVIFEAKGNLDKTTQILKRLAARLELR